MKFLVLLVCGCTASGDDIRPDPGQFYFPTAMAVSSGMQPRLFVGNANGDLRFDSGSVVAVDLSQVDSIATAWTQPMASEPEGCQRDITTPSALECDERPFILGQGDTPGDGARIGNFVTDMKTQALSDGRERLFLAVRGDPSLTWIDFDPAAGTLSCSADTGYDRCDPAHRLSTLLGNKKLKLEDEPFSLHVDGANQYVLSSHLSDGVVTLSSAPQDGAAPELMDEIRGLFAGLNPNSLVGALGIAGRTPGQPNDLIYVTSRTHATVPTLVVSNLAAAGRLRLSSGPQFTLSRLTGSNNARDIVFNQTGNRAYILNRDPPALHVIDTSLDETGTPRNDLLRAVILCQQPARLATTTINNSERVYVSCFNAAQVWSIDPDSGERLAMTLVGRGPNTLSVIEMNGRKRLFVGNVLEDTIAVMDIDAGGAFENRVIMKIGLERQSEDEQ